MDAQKRHDAVVVVTAASVRHELVPLYAFRVLGDMTFVVASAEPTAAPDVEAHTVPDAHDSKAHCATMTPLVAEALVTEHAMPPSVYTAADTGSGAYTPPEQLPPSHTYPACSVQPAEHGPAVRHATGAHVPLVPVHTPVYPTTVEA